MRQTIWGMVLLAGMMLLTNVETQAQETQIPFDSQGMLMDIDAEMAESLELFTFIEGFQVARLFQHADGAYTLEVRYTRNGEEVTVRDAVAEWAYDDLRTRVDDGLSRIRLSGEE